MADSNSPTNEDSNNAEEEIAGNGDVEEDEQAQSDENAEEDAGSGKGDADEDDETPESKKKKTKHTDSSSEPKNPVKCDVCDDMLEDKSKLDKHMRDNHKKVWEKNQKGDPYRCVECGAVYFEQNRFQYHVQLHNWPSFDP